MALYLGREKGVDEPRLIKGDNPAAAIRHMARGRFTVDAITDPTVAADWAAKGIKIETAGEDPPAPAPAPLPERRINIETGMVEKRDPGKAGEAAGYVADKPATLDELAGAETGAIFRIDVPSGMIQRQPAGADSEHWEDLREATKEEIAAAKKK